MLEKYSTNGQKISVIEAGPDDALRLMMLHGGPGYYWPEGEIADLSNRLQQTGTYLKIEAVQSRGCGIGNYISPYQDLLDDNLYKRSEDLKAFDSPEILLGHSTGAMVALTAVMEGFIKPEKIILLSPYTASLGEHEYWITKKAEKYPKVFGQFYSYVEAQWQKYKGELPKDLKEKLYMYWGELFFSLPNDDEKVKANIHYLNFHVIDSMPSLGTEDGEPFTYYKTMLENFAQLDQATKDTLVRIGTINAHWWQTNYQDGYPFFEKLKSFDFDMPITILSGDKDEITPPETVQKLADILKVKSIIAKNSYHIPEINKPGKLKEHLVTLLNEIALDFLG